MKPVEMTVVMILGYINKIELNGMGNNFKRENFTLTLIIPQMMMDSCALPLLERGSYKNVLALYNAVT